MNIYMDEWLVRDRLGEAEAFAAQEALVRSLRPTRHPVRVRAGLLLIAAGRWLAHTDGFSDGTARQSAAHGPMPWKEMAAAVGTLADREGTRVRGVRSTGSGKRDVAPSHCTWR